MYILPSMAKALLGRFCYASNFVQAPHIALRSCYLQQGERRQGVSVYACCACVQ